MSELTPRNRFTIPSQNEEPFYTSMKSFFLADDAAHWAVAENGNLTYNGGGVITWNASTATLTWTAQISISGFTSASLAKALIQGPPSPGGILTIQDGQVAFYTMPRLMQSDAVVTLKTSSRIYQPDGTRLHDLRLFCARVGDTVLFPDGKSLKDGESAVLFGGGIGTTIPPHMHQPALVIEPPTIGVSTLDLQIITLGYTRLVLINKVGEFTLTETVLGGLSSTTGVVVETGANYILVNPVTGVGFQAGEAITGNFNLVDITVASVAGFVINGAVTAGAATGTIRDINGLVLTVKVNSGTFPGSGAITQTSPVAATTISSTSATYNPTADIIDIVPPTNLRKVEIFRNGQLLVEGSTRDYTVNYTTGIVTLAVPTVTTTERFVALRETVPGVDVTGLHSHSKLIVPILVGTPILSTIQTGLDPSPNKLQQINLYRNGALQAEPSDYSLDITTGIITLVTAALVGETFIIDRELA